MGFINWLGTNLTILGPLLGALLGGGLTYWLQTRKQRRTARMCVVTDLRHWMQRVMPCFYDQRTLADSGDAKVPI